MRNSEKAVESNNKFYMEKMKFFFVFRILKVINYALQS